VPPPAPGRSWEGGGGRSTPDQQHRNPRQAPAPWLHGAAARAGPAARRRSCSVWGAARARHAPLRAGSPPAGRAQAPAWSGQPRDPAPPRVMPGVVVHHGTGRAWTALGHSSVPGAGGLLGAEPAAGCCGRGRFAAGGVFPETGPQRVLGPGAVGSPRVSSPWSRGRGLVATGSPS